MIFSEKGVATNPPLTQHGSIVCYCTIFFIPFTRSNVIKSAFRLLQQCSFDNPKIRVPKRNGSRVLNQESWSDGVFDIRCKEFLQLNVISNLGCKMIPTFGYAQQCGFASGTCPEKGVSALAQAAQSTLAMECQGAMTGRGAQFQ